MKLLLDTHAFLWFIDDNRQLSVNAKALIGDPGHEKYVSIGSAWEIAIKVSKGKLSLAPPVELLFPLHIQQNSFQLLAIDWPHLAALQTLPAQHNDPFDRLLIAQALAESMAIVSIDPTFDAYAVSRLW